MRGWTGADLKRIRAAIRSLVLASGVEPAGRLALLRWFQGRADASLTVAAALRCESERSLRRAEVEDRGAEHVRDKPHIWGCRTPEDEGIRRIVQDRATKAAAWRRSARLFERLAVRVEVVGLADDRVWVW